MRWSGVFSALMTTTEMSNTFRMWQCIWFKVSLVYRKIILTYKTASVGWLWYEWLAIGDRISIFSIIICKCKQIVGFCIVKFWGILPVISVGNVHYRLGIRTSVDLLSLFSNTIYCANRRSNTVCKCWKCQCHQNYVRGITVIQFPFPYNRFDYYRSNVQHSILFQMKLIWCIRLYLCFFWLCSVTLPTANRRFLNFPCHCDRFHARASKNLIIS